MVVWSCIFVMFVTTQDPPLIVLPKNFASQSPFLTHLRKRLQWTRDLLKLRNRTEATTTAPDWTLNGPMDLNGS
ncbi:uncharacterized protein LOC108021867 isoform X7 [Drosophila biarmipes]|uniref:uncharacterized protein LOC108021867 isoform X6 n=1 Tax=Drosophila biarmipes TaxID=125945 RepID=UPI0021CD0376|nr:uncharacterized protein LOC108021867 isoform X6 [Drosophila biarmipes]XP_050745874.1 uncharacterized protein LOC108021867 isoform X7 [Drosophila biarmipes]